jgi:two-component system, chemotaxis family, chemotaxis protein CheY
MTSPSVHCPVLIVEDDEDLREMMAQLLTLEGYEAATVANGREALDYLHHTRTPNVILLDLMMPVMDGPAFAQALRDRQLGARIPIVVISADGNPQKAAAVGATGFLAKPFDIDALLAQVSDTTGASLR